MEKDGPSFLERSLLLHLLDHRGHQVRFEADQWTTEFGILRAFAQADLNQVKNAIRSLETSRWIYRRMQYVIGFSEPKLVFSLTPSGHRKALDLRREVQGPEMATPLAPGEVTDFNPPPSSETGPQGDSKGTI